MNQTGDTSKLGIVEYKFDHQPHSFKIKAQNLSKPDKPIQPTAPSTRVLIENITRNTASGPTKLYYDVLKIWVVSYYIALLVTFQEMCLKLRVRNEARWVF